MKLRTNGSGSSSSGGGGAGGGISSSGGGGITASGTSGSGNGSNSQRGSFCCNDAVIATGCGVVDGAAAAGLGTPTITHYSHSCPLNTYYKHILSKHVTKKIMLYLSTYIPNIPSPAPS